MKKTRRNAGFTFAETMLVAAILAVLAGLGTVSVQTYRESQRSLTKMQYDTYAREIFVAAQNHLSMVAAQGYLGHTNPAEYGRPEVMNEENPDDPSNVGGKGRGVYYFVCDPTHDADNPILKLMLPTYAVDENARDYGGYIIRYHHDSAQILDVFFWARAELMKYPHKTYQDSDYQNFWDNRAVKDYMKRYGSDESVIGYYGGASGTDAMGGGGNGSSDSVINLTRDDELKAPSIVVTNGDQLKVDVTNPNRKGTLKLIITGLTSGGVKEVDLNITQPNMTVILDDITMNNSVTVPSEVENGDSRHFYERFYDYQQGLIPGENVEIQAVAFSTQEFTNVAFSSKVTTNSLFGDDSDPENGVVKISNIRHLENLDPDISCVNNTSGVLDVHSTQHNITITKAEQTTDLDWTRFFNNDTFGKDDDLKISPITGPSADTKCFIPVTPGSENSATNEEYVFEYYDGGGHSISNITVKSAENAGLFGTLTGGSVHDLQLMDFKVEGTDRDKAVGALAGTATGTTFNNVLARNSRGFERDNLDNGEPATTVTGKGSTGGLIGSVENCTIEYCAASLVVKTDNGDAGGLVGTATGTTSITGSYSGGHTNNAKYSPAVKTDGTGKYNVTGTGNVGGLVGSFDGTKIEYSYSTCSVSVGTSGNVGGLAGFLKVSDKVKDCYATGRVDKTGTAGAFAGTLSGTVTNSGDIRNYYMIVNEDPVNKGTYMNPLGGENTNDTIKAFDENAGTYDKFVDKTRESALPYDAALNRYYHGKYNFLTVIQLAQRAGETIESGFSPFVRVHYGDWPSEEVWVVNETT